MRDGCVRRSATGWRALVAALVLGLALAPAAAAASPPDAPVADAAERGDGAAVRALIAEGADVNAPQGDGMTGLHWAAERGDLGIVDALLHAGADVDAVTRLGRQTPLHLAAAAGAVPVVHRLLEAGADPGVTTATGGGTPLHLAARAGSTGSIAALVDAGSEVDVREASRDQTPLMFAAAENRTGAVRALLERGADPSLRSRVLDVVRQAESDEAAGAVRDSVLEAFRQKAPDPATWSPTPRQVQAAARAAEQARREHWHGAFAGEEDGGTGSRLSHPELVGRQGGLTPLLYAVREGHRATAEALLDAGADLDRPSGSDHTAPLMIAAMNGHFDLALELLERGADPSLSSDAGATPLFAAVNTYWAPKARYPQQYAYQQQETSHLELMRALLEAGADPNVRLEKHPWYLEYNFNQLSVRIGGATPFWRAAHALDVEAMKLLVEHGADPTIPTKKPPERRRYGDDEGEERVDPSGLPPVPAGGPGVPPVVAAAGVGYGGGDGAGRAGNSHRHVPDGWLPAMRYLVEELGADVNTRDHNGYTPLHFAAGRGDTELARYLVRQGADVTAVNREGKTTVDMANGPVQRIQPFPETIGFLESMGAKNNHACVSC